MIKNRLGHHPSKNRKKLLNRYKPGLREAIVSVVLIIQEMGD